jgi:BirA family transcriptional regulator, biotin operon repressor / biotin---[acetyl-CoA-carboxylase] ligase
MDRLDAAALSIPGMRVRVVERCGSTNTALLEEKSVDCVLLAAEQQTAGRGRRGRRWHSVPGAGLTFSLALQVRRPVRELAGLSLVAGVAVSKALRALGVARAALKWPNDLVVDGAKLGGILVETRSAGAATRAVIGIGINCRRDSGLALRVRRPVASLDEYIEVRERNSILKKIIPALLESLDLFESKGLEPLRREWEAMSAHAGQRLRVRLADGRVLSGISGGIAEDGALRLTTRNGIKTIRSGRVVSARQA